MFIPCPAFLDRKDGRTAGEPHLIHQIQTSFFLMKLPFTSPLLSSILVPSDIKSLSHAPKSPGQAQAGVPQSPVHSWELSCLVSCCVCAPLHRSHLLNPNSAFFWDLTAPTVAPSGLGGGGGAPNELIITWTVSWEQGKHQGGTTWHFLGGKISAAIPVWTQG